MANRIKNVIYTIICISIAFLFIYGVLINLGRPHANLLVPSFVSYFLLPIILITFIFYRTTWEQLMLNFYNSVCKQNISRESLFLGVLFFLCILPFFSVPLFFGFQWGPKPFNDESALLLFGSFLLSLAISTPLGISIYFGKKWLNSETPKRMISKMPLSTIVPSFIFSILLWIYLGFLPGGHPPAASLWLFYFWIYILIVALLSTILSVYLYFYKFQQNKTTLKYLAILLVSLPYLIGAFGMMS